MSLSFNFNTTKTKRTALEFNKIYDTIVVGSGPAGFNAALYAKRKGLEVGILTKRIGGQLLNTSSVDNYLGLNDISGEGLSDKFLEHVEALEIPILEEVEVLKTEKLDKLFTVTLTNGKTIQAKTLILTTGSNPRKLEVKGENEFANKGVAYCAICDAPLFKDKKVIIAGGGNSAVEAAIDVAKWASEVVVVHRSNFRADKIVLDQMLSNPKITTFIQTQILEIVGDQKMTGVKVLDKVSNKEFVINADGIFIEIGNIPNSDLFEGFVQRNEFKEIIIDAHQQTSVAGCFAAGDVTTAPYKQIVISVADGAKAALAANEYINHQFSQ